MSSPSIGTRFSQPWLLGVRLRRLNRSLPPRSRTLLTAAVGLACLAAAAFFVNVLLFAAASSLFAARAGRLRFVLGGHRPGVSSGLLPAPRYKGLVGAADEPPAPALDWEAVTGGGGSSCRMRRPEATLVASYVTPAHSFVAFGGVDGAPLGLAARAAPDRALVVGVAGLRDACIPALRGGGSAAGRPAVACATSAGASDLLVALESTAVGGGSEVLDRVLVMGCGGEQGRATVKARDELMAGLGRLLRSDSIVFYHGWPGAAASASSRSSDDGDGPSLPEWLITGCYAEVAAVVATADGWGGLLVVRPTAEFLAGHLRCTLVHVQEGDAAEAVDSDLVRTWSATAARFNYKAWSLHRRFATAGARMTLDGVALAILGGVAFALRRAGFWGGNPEGRPSLLGD